MSDSIRLAGWKPAPNAPKTTATKVPARIEYRYCPMDMGHWRVSGEKCPVCQSPIRVLAYLPLEVVA